MDQGKATIINGVIVAIATVLAAVIGLYAYTVHNENTSLKEANTQLVEQVEAAENVEFDSETTIEELQSTISAKDDKIAGLKNTIAEQGAAIAEKDEQIAHLKNTIAERDSTIAEKDKEIADLKEELEKYIKPTDPNPPTEVPSDEEWEELIPCRKNSGSTIYDGSDNSHYFTVGGIRRTKGVHLWGDYNYAIWNTQQQYSKFKFKIYSMGEENATMTIVIGDKPYEETYDLAWDGEEKEIVVPIDYAKQVEIELRSDRYSEWGIYDCYVCK